MDNGYMIEKPPRHPFPAGDVFSNAFRNELPWPMPQRSVLAVACKAQREHRVMELALDLGDSNIAE